MEPTEPVTVLEERRKQSISQVAQNAVKQSKALYENCEFHNNDLQVCKICPMHGFMSTFNVVKSSALIFGCVLVIWLLGYFQFSLLWLFIGVAVYMWRERRREKNQLSSQVASDIAKDERKFLQTVQEVYKITGKDLPSWVYFPDIEKAEWLNIIVLQLWPYVGDFVKTILEEQVEPSIQQSNGLLSSFKFSEIDLGDNAPRVVGVKVYNRGQTRRTEIVMDLQIVFHSDCNFKVSVNALSAGIKNFTMKGHLRIELRPLIDTIPLVGAVSVAFIQKPFINFDLTDLGNFLDLPGVDSMLRGAVTDCVCGLLVLPERYILKLSDVDISSLKFPLPKGAVRIHIIEARNLEEKDKKILGIGGGSDPYVIVKVISRRNSLKDNKLFEKKSKMQNIVPMRTRRKRSPHISLVQALCWPCTKEVDDPAMGHDQEFRTQIIEHNVNPTWDDEYFDALVHDIYGTSIEVTLYDDDGSLNRADYLGSATVTIKSIYKQGEIDEWITLSNVEKGSIHVKLQWLELSDDKTNVKFAISEAKKTNKTLNAAFVNVYVDSAKEVVDVNESRYEPSPQLRVQFPGQSKPWKSSVVEDSAHPVWEESCKSFIEKPLLDTIKFTVKNCPSVTGIRANARKVSNHVFKHLPLVGRHGKVENASKTASGEILGELRIKTRQLLESPGMSKEEPFALTSGGPNSTLSMRLTMRLLVPVGKKDPGSSEHSFVVSPKKKISSDKKLSSSLHSIIEDTEDDGSSNVDPMPPMTPVTPSTPTLVHRRIEKASPVSPIKFDNNNLHRSPSTHSTLSDSSNNNGMENLKQRLDKKLESNGSASHKYPLGRLNLSLKYLRASETLLVEVHKAENLIICDDDNKTSDPYVRIYVLPARKKRRKTKVIKNELNPVFNETLKFDLTETEMKRNQLEIAVKNETGMLSSEKILMGQLYIDLATLDFPSATNKWYPLTVHPHSE